MCSVRNQNWTDEERVRDEILSEKKGVGQDRRAGLAPVLCQGRGREKRLIAAQIDKKINAVLGEGVKWKGKVPSRDINVAVRAGLTGSGCFKASLFLAGTPLLRFVYIHTQLWKWSVLKCINYLCLGFSKFITIGKIKVDFDASVLRLNCHWF